MLALPRFFWDSFKTVVTGGLRYHLWMGGLSLVMLAGLFAWSIQLRQGLVVTGMSDHVSWGLYISNFIFLVGLAAAAVMLVMPAYVLKDMDFSKAVLIGEGVAVSALLMCLTFVTVDLGGPQNVWHMMPVIGQLRFPQSLLAWDVIVLNGYLALNLLIPFYILFNRYQGKVPKKKVYVPFVYLSVFWAVAIHMVTAFLLAGLPARPFWNSSLLGPRFLASAFAAGPAFMIIALSLIRRYSSYKIPGHAIDKLAMITTVAAQINLIMLGSELFKEFYWPTHHSHSAQYLFFGLWHNGHFYDGLVNIVRPAVLLNAATTICLTVHVLRRNHTVLVVLCLFLFISIWLEKGMGLVVPGFIPSPLGEIVEYAPTWIEITVTLGIWAMGFFVFTCLARVAIRIETGRLRYRSQEE